ncbi:MAG: phosphoribosyl-AMP cyclohydrolase [Dehalococcoidia bacterium]|nr:phosphoribosyl-AMP cyclohydrolase [Dehalococcoidia bacterium]
MIKYDSVGLVPAVIQDVDNGDVLMLGYMNEESVRRTLESGDVWFYSRSRQELWHKGETSGNFLRMRSMQFDCDGDTILVKAKPVGPVCHTGNRTCFFQDVTKESLAR